MLARWNGETGHCYTCLRQFKSGELIDVDGAVDGADCAMCSKRAHANCDWELFQRIVQREGAERAWKAFVAGVLACKFGHGASVPTSVMETVRLAGESEVTVSSLLVSLGFRRP